MPAIINYHYLQQLEHPQEAITNDVWIAFRNTIVYKSEQYENFKRLLEMDIKTVATNCGVLWKNETSENIYDIITQDYVDIRTRQHIGSWKKRSIVLTIAKLAGMGAEELDTVLVTPPSEKELEAQIKTDLYERARIDINRMMVDSRRNFTDETYEEDFKNIVKFVLSKIFAIGEYKEERIVRYATITIERICGVHTLKEISEKNNIQIGVINNIIKNLGTDFRTNIFTEQSELDTLDGRLMSYYETAFTTLDKTDLDIWKERLESIKMFRKYFIGIELDS